MGKFANNYQSAFKNARQRSQSAFTLVEMLAVMGIIATMLGMVLPAINDALGSKGRKGAVNILLNTFEQARVAALEQSTNVYVGFADKEALKSTVRNGDNVKDFPYTRFITFRDYNPDLDPPAASGTPPKFVVLTKWQKLPNGISFKSSKSLDSDLLTGETVSIAPTDSFPTFSAYTKMPVLKFNSTGGISPVTKNLRVFLYEGFFSDTSDVFVRRKGQGESKDEPYGLFERISFARYTGRAQLDITEITKVSPAS